MASFETWLSKKARLDHGQQILRKLPSPQHEGASDSARFTLENVTLASVAIDASMGLLEVKQTSVKKCSMRKDFFNWCTKHVRFESICLDVDDICKFTESFKAVRLEEGRFDETCILASCRYSFAKKLDRHDSAKAAASKALSRDELAENMLFSKLVCRSWDDACIRLFQNAMENFSVKSSHRKKKIIHSTQDEREQVVLDWSSDVNLVEEKSNSEYSASTEDNLRKTRIYNTLNNGPEVFETTPQEWDQFLLNVGVIYLREMREYCHEKELESSRLEALEKQNEARKAFESFIKTKIKRKCEQGDNFTDFIDENNLGERACSYDYDLWKTKKEMILAAQGALKYIDQPADSETWIDIGKNLKAVDQSLYQTWIEWGNVTPRDKVHSRILWDFFEPRFCDVHYGSSRQEERQCIYKTTCYSTGMLNAFKLSTDGALLEEPERKRRHKILKYYFGNDYNDKLGDNCALVRQPISIECSCISELAIKSKDALSTLRKLCYESKQARSLHDALKSGCPPSLPKLKVLSTDKDMSSCAIPLCWCSSNSGPTKATLCILEMMMLSGQFVEIHRDENSDVETMKNRYLANDLKPSTTYTFRLRAYNTFGHSPYSYVTYTTHPVSPPSPVLEKASIEEISISWENDGKQICANGDKCFDIVEQCVNMDKDVWKVVSKVRTKHATIAQLESGSTYVFRVYAVTEDGIESSRSLWTAMNTLLPKPPAVRQVGKNAGLQCDSFTLLWSRYDHLNGSRGNCAAFDTSWTSSNDCSLLFNVFSAFDETGNGTIDPGNLPDVLHKLGVKNSPWRTPDAANQIDRCEHGRIKYSSFEKWWRGDYGPIYLLYRCEGSPSKKSGMESISLCYHGKTCGPIKITGLSPSTTYTLRLKVISPNSNSGFCDVTICTAPEPPTCAPIAIETGHDHLYIKLSLNHRKKVVLQRKLVGKDDWCTVYSGFSQIVKVTHLNRNSEYQLRYRVIDDVGTASEWSPQTMVRTKENFSTNRFISICTLPVSLVDDLVVGDLIAFTESIHSESDDDSYWDVWRQRSKSNGCFLERQIVARVVKVNVEEESDVQLEIVFCSRLNQGDDTRIQEGCMIHRSEEDLFCFEVRRACWEHEELRR
uniref:Calmodulin n=2 Tax=Leptocylindrus danicus TaxID=163516 RepID=A0A7S2JX63_9STRA|mmetsp:Transcript_13565/g.20153  ORF Transcript_13565/g.20153 Transcript_13565/m.20153 type:complete len:1112 (+) Transcript_13565:757-4092(+)